MKNLGLIFALLLVLAVAGCAGVMEGQGTVSPTRDQYPNTNWGTDPTCSPGCPPGMSGSW